jgi:dienelactone hydrolase
MRIAFAPLVGTAALLALAADGLAQSRLHPTTQPGDQMMVDYLRAGAESLHARSADDLRSAEDWLQRRPRLQEEYLYMLGLWPLPPRTHLSATITRSMPGQGFVVDMIHYQSRPGLYVTGNLYRPAAVKPGERLPAVLYVCGHTARGRNGNKTAYQSHGMWFARHGYVCLVLDTLQLGEIAATHKGVYNDGRWWWYSRGYTPAGVECWNGVRGIDYLASRPDVDPNRVAVTGISGGGAATYWIAAADERAKVAVAVSGMADLPTYVSHQIINRHCDCMFMYNAFGWPWTRIAMLIAPRPLLFVNSNQDQIFPMDANDRIINLLERFYALFGAGDRVDAVVSVGGHAYREDLRQAAYRFINTHMKNDPRTVTDSEVDLVDGKGEQAKSPIDPAQLRVFPEDSDLPKDQLNTTIDRSFVPMAEVKPPVPGQFETWKQGLLAELRRVTFSYLPERIPAATVAERVSPKAWRLATEPGIEIHLRLLVSPMATPARAVIVITNPERTAEAAEDLSRMVDSADVVYACDVRGTGAMRWTRQNPPNYIERSHALLGRTPDSGRVWDIAATARYLRLELGNKVPVHVAGQGSAGVLGAYAAILEPDIAGVTLVDPPASHMEPTAPVLLNVLRVCDIPEVLGMVAPRPLTIVGGQEGTTAKVSAEYAAAGAQDRLRHR